MDTKSWNVCKVCGYVVACDPGIQNFSSYPMEYERGELRVKMNLSAGNGDLPAVVVKAIGDDFLEVRAFGKNHKIVVGDYFQTPRKGLSYAYSEVVITLE